MPQTADQMGTFLAGSPLPMVATEGPAHNVRYVNPAFCWLIGQTAEVTVGSPLSALLRRVSTAPNVPGLLDVVYSTGTAEFAVDLAPAPGAADPNAIPITYAVWPVLGPDGLPGGLLLQVNSPSSHLTRKPLDSPATDELREVNERLVLAGLKAQEQAELQLTLRGEAEAAVKLRDEFMSIAAHELRTPVTGIKISAQLALRLFEDANADQERTLQYLRGIVGGANRLVVLMNDLMDVSRMRSGELMLGVTQIDLGVLVKTVALRYVGPGGDDHHLSIDVPAEPVYVSGDGGRLEQILDNLLSNAIKYSPAGGAIDVLLRKALDGVELTVNDEGIGLPPGEQDRIFEPFGRAANATKRGLPGMGLGLHICRQIAAAHGGRMWAESDGEGCGMTIGMWLPAWEARTNGTRPSPATAS